MVQCVVEQWLSEDSKGGCCIAVCRRVLAQGGKGTGCSDAVCMQISCSERRGKEAIFAVYGQSSG